jgi:hypothetical protein
MSIPLEVNNLKIYKGTDFDYDFQLYDENGKINLTGCQVVSKLKKYPGSKTFNAFEVYFVDRVNGIIRLMMNNQTTRKLESGRNYFNVLIIYSNTKVKPVIVGTAIVEESPASFMENESDLGKLGNVDTTNLQDGEVLMYNQNEQKLEFVNPDEVLDKAAVDGLPDDFVTEVQTDLDNKFNVDFGEY